MRLDRHRVELLMKALRCGLVVWLVLNTQLHHCMQALGTTLPPGPVAPSMQDE